MKKLLTFLILCVVMAAIHADTELSIADYGDNHAVEMFTFDIYSLDEDDKNIYMASLSFTPIISRGRGIVNLVIVKSDGINAESVRNVTYDEWPMFSLWVTDDTYDGEYLKIIVPHNQMPSKDSLSITNREDWQYFLALLSRNRGKTSLTVSDGTQSFVINLEYDPVKFANYLSQCELSNGIN